MNTQPARRTPAARLTAIATLVAATLLIAFAATPVLAGHNGAHLTGTTGEIIDPAADFAGFHLRYVGTTPPAGYSHSYQWVGPRVSAEPDAGPVTLEGTLDFSGRDDDGSVTMIGLADVAALAGGASGYQRGAYVYVNNRANGTVRVGPSDGNAGGEIVQTFVTVPEATADGGPIGVTLTIDGTADPATCASNAADIPTADGCITVELDGFLARTDSYGTIVASDGGGPVDEEFAAGAIPGWEVFPSEKGKTGYDLNISPATVTIPLTDKDQCKQGGWESHGFKNQGQCVRFIETGKDSR